MKKIHKIAALLAMLLPSVTWGASRTYYAQMTAGVTSLSPAGSGTFYLGTSAATSSSSYNTGTTSLTSSTKGGSWISTPSSLDVQFYLVAKANPGYVFCGWFDNEAGTGTAKNTDASYNPTVTSSAQSSSSPATASLYAKFERLPPATITFEPADNGSYTANGEVVSAQLVKSNQEVPYSVSLVATPAANAQFAGWYIIEPKKSS